MRHRKRIQKCISIASKKRGKKVRKDINHKHTKCRKRSELQSAYSSTLCVMEAGNHSYGFPFKDCTKLFIPPNLGLLGLREDGWLPGGE